MYNPDFSFRQRQNSCHSLHGDTSIYPISLHIPPTFELVAENSFLLFSIHLVYLMSIPAFCALSSNCFFTQRSSKYFSQWQTSSSVYQTPFLSESLSIGQRGAEQYSLSQSDLVLPLMRLLELVSYAPADISSHRQAEYAPDRPELSCTNGAPARTVSHKWSKSRSGA